MGVNHYLHKISNDIIERTKRTKSMIVFEDLKGIRKLYKKGKRSGQQIQEKLIVFYEF